MTEPLAPTARPPISDGTTIGAVIEERDILLAAVKYVADNTCEVDEGCCFKFGYDPQVVRDALAEFLLLGDACDISDGPENCTSCGGELPSCFMCCDETMGKYCGKCWRAVECGERHGEGCATKVFT